MTRSRARSSAASPARSSARPSSRPMVFVPEEPLSVPLEVSDDLRAALDEAARGRGVILSQEQLEHWAATGEWPWQTEESSD